MSDTSAVGLQALSGTFAGLTTITIAMRFYSRHRSKAPVLIDDWLMIPAWLSFIGAVACYFLAVKYKVLGYSKYDLTKEEQLAHAADSSKLQVAISVCIVLCLGCTKASALFFYQRLFCVGRKTTLNHIIVASIVVVALWTLTFEFLTGFQCGTHFTALWDGSYLKYCTISFPFLYGEAISDFLLDVWVLCLPILPIMRLHTTIRRRIGFLGIFLLACVGIGASIGKMVVYIDIELAGKEAFIKYDQERMLTKSFYFLMLEAGISCVAVNLPSVWMLFASVSPEAVLRSVRSMISLGSLGSRNSRGSRSKDSTGRSETVFKANPSVESQLPLSNSPGKYSTEVIADNGGAQGSDHHTVGTSIHITHSIEQSTSSKPVEKL